MFKYKSIILVLIISALTIFSLTSCDEESSPLQPQEEHFEAVGLVVTQSGIRIVDYFAPDYNPNVTAINDTIRISQGLNPHMEVKFYDINKNVIDPPTDADKSFGAWFENPAVTELWWHSGEEGSYEFHMKGLQEGETRLKFQVLHAGHADFETLPIVVQVDNQVLHGEPTGIKIYVEESGVELASAGLQANNTFTGQITVANGDTTDHLVVYFVDVNGTEFWPPAPPYSINITSSNQAIASVTGLEADEPFAFKIAGMSNGAASIKIELLHQSNIEFSFTQIPVSVN
jgi:hypothetical protein